MDRIEILKKVENLENQGKTYFLRCLKVGVCPKCGSTLKKEHYIHYTAYFSVKCCACGRHYSAYYISKGLQL